MEVERDKLVDIMKGIGICFVIMGHVLTYKSTLSRCVFSFHMPLFFFLSGYLARKKSSLFKWRSYWQSLSKYLVLYLFFTLLGLIRFALDKNIPTDTIRVAIYRTFIHCHSFVNGPTWFLVTLPLSLFLPYCFSRVKNGGLRYVLIASTLCTMALLSLLIQRLPWELRRLWIPLNVTNLPLVSFYALCGWQWGSNMMHLPIRLSIVSNFIIVCTLSSFIFALSRQNMIGMMNCSVAEAGSILNFPIALLGIQGVCCVAHLWGETLVGRHLQVIGMRSLAFFTCDFISLTIVSIVLSFAMPVFSGYTPTQPISLPLSFLLWFSQMCVLMTLSPIIMKVTTSFMNCIPFLDKLSAGRPTVSDI
ncbi:MAG: Acyltransferase family protein [Lentisphaerae bacterium ADurb.Bin082]|nr:MAG: Acyltransferase family protein [Lentisphaerae bacterium ADurb.Bin082]